MQIRLHKDAGSLYLGRCNCHYQPVDWNFKYVLDCISGEVLDVETKYLFSNQFNTAPISKEKQEQLLSTKDYANTPEVKRILNGPGLRIYEYLCSEVIDDERKGKQRCNYCGNISDATIDALGCPHCDSGSEYVFKF